METLLFVITVIAVATALVALTSAARLRRRERERSEARVAALAAAAETHGGADGGWTQVGGEWQWTPAAQTTPVPNDSGLGIRTNRAVREERVMSVADPIPNPHSQIPEIGDTVAHTSSGAFFGTVQRDEPSGNRLPIFAAAALIVMLGGALIFLNTSTTNDHAATAADAGRHEPLELVALGHAREVSVLTITGTVRNPASGVKVEQLTAVISLLDRDGALVSTKDVPLDYRALGPGEEAPFKVSVPDPGSVARYRVSFRSGSDVVPHVDRRVDTKLASAVQ